MMIFKHFDPDYVKISYFPGSNDECIVEAERIAKDKGYTAKKEMFLFRRNGI